MYIDHFTVTSLPLVMYY